MIKPFVFVLCTGLVLSSSCGGGPEAWDGNLLVITLDTTRADHLGCYGNAGVATPHLDRLAAGGVRFARACSPVPLTLPSHCTIFTGKYPVGHGVRNNGTYYLGEGHRTLAELFHQRGYHTYAVVAAFVLLAKFGLHQGFDIFDDSLDSYKILNTYRSEIQADAVYEKFHDWYKRNGDRRFMAWVHFYDPHTPYHPPEGFFSQEDKKDKPALYAGEIEYMDSVIGKIIAELEDTGRLKDTLLVIVGDHGEAFGEHVEYAEHQTFCYQENINVPLIFYNRTLFPESRVLKERVGTADIMPTLIDLYGFDPPEGLQGRSLTPLLRGDKPQNHEPIYFESMYGREEMGWAPLTGIIDENYKYIALPQAELYDLEEDPGETRNLFRVKSHISRRMDKKLAALVAKFSGKGGDSRRDLSGSDLEHLKSLGYVSAFSGSDAGNLDPKEGIRFNERLRELSRRVGDGELDGPERALLQILDQQPEKVNYIVYTLLYRINMKQKQFTRGLNWLRRGMERFPEALAFREMLANRLFEQGELREAKALCEGLLEKDPAYSRALILLGDIALKRSNLVSALEHYRRAVEIEPENVSLRIKYAELLIRDKQMAAALEMYNSTLDNVDVRANASILYKIALFNTRYGDLQRAETLLRRVVDLERDGRHLHSLALVLAKNRRIVEALRMMKEALNRHNGELNDEQRETARRAIQAWQGAAQVENPGR